MKKNLLYSFAALFACLFLFGMQSAQAQLTLPAGTSYTQNFDAIGGGLPTGWTVRNTATAATLGASTTYTAAATAWSDSAGNFKNSASADGLAAGATTLAQSNATDRALSVRQTAAFANPGASFTFAIANTTNKTAFSLQMKHQMLSVQSKSTTWTVQYATDGTGTAWTTLGTYTDPAAFGSTDATYNFGSALNNISNTVYIRIVALALTTGSGTNDTYGIDDFVLSWANAALPTLTTNGTASLTFSTQNTTTASASQSFNLSGTDLSGAPGNITVTAPANFQVSADNGTFGTTASIPYTTATLSSTPVYVRFAPQSSGAKTGNLTFSGGGTSSNPTIALSGTGIVPAPTAQNATNITNTAFQANWDAVSGASSYRLDVSTTPFAAIGTTPWINEFHYDNAGTDANEFIELIVPASYAGTGLTITLYDGANGQSYNTVTLAQMTAGEINALYTVYSYTFPANGLQNGDPDGFSLSDNSGVLQFLSYDGSFNATNGAASGMASTNIGVGEPATTVLGSSLYLTGTGTTYANFSWAVGTATNTKGTLNAGQVLSGGTFLIQDLNVGNVTSYSVTGLTPETPYYYRVRAVDANSTSENSLVTSVITTAITTWGGATWSQGTPTAALNAVINAAYDTVLNGIFTAKSLTITPSGSLAIKTNTNITIVNEVTNNANAAAFVIENNANLLQTGTTNNNSGPATVHRNASMKRLDYVYWSSPVAGQNLQAFSPNTLANRFYTIDEATNSFQTANVANDFALAKGYVIRAPNDYPTTNTPYLGTFTGTLNNGTINIALTKSGSGFNLIGNPYASTINADDFLDANTSIATLYFWTHTTQGAPSGANYATYNATGAAAASTTTPASEVPNGTIQTGQGFVVDTNAATNATFLNTMRVPNNDGQFFRTANSEKNRIWLNLSNENGMMNQTLIGYVGGASNALDFKYDARLAETQGIKLYSVVNDNPYIIQGRALPFAAEDTVAMGFTTNTAGTFTISVDHVDGLFAAGQEVFLKDNLTGTSHNFNDGGYTFATEAGTFNSRFSVVYQNTTLGVNDPSLTEAGTILYKNNGMLNINSGAAVMQSVKISDMSGRVIFERKGINASRVVLDDLRASQQVLIVQITSEDQKTINKKVVY